MPFVVLVALPVTVSPTPGLVPTLLHTAPGLVYIGERKYQLASAALRSRPQRGRPSSIVSLEIMPAETALGVLVVKEIDQPAGRPFRRRVFSCPD